MTARTGSRLKPIARGFVQQGRHEIGCVRNYIALTRTALPKLFHKFMTLAMITPSRCCDSIRRVSSRAPMQRLTLSVFGWAYYILHAYARGVFFITMLVGLAYGQLGFAIVPLAKLRIEEVFVGCLVSLAAAVLLMPSTTARAAAALDRK